MPEREQQDESLAGLVVKEAVERGMETEFRDQIVEAVETAEGGTSGRARKLPLAGVLVGLGAAIGYLAGRGELDTAGTRLEDAETPNIVDEVTEKTEEAAETVETEEATETAETTETEGRGHGRLFTRLVLVAGAVVGLEFLRRRRASEEEWEPIEEFEPATDAAFGEESEDEAEEESEEEEAEATMSEDESEEDTEE